MFRYLAMVFFVLSVNCGKNDDPAIAFFELLDAPKSMIPPEPDIEKIINSLNAIPESTSQKGKEFLTNILSDLESYPAENFIRKYVENAATVMAFFEHARFEPSTEQISIIKEKMKQLGPKFEESLVKVGQSTELLRAARPWQKDDFERLKNEHSDSMTKAMRELDSSIIEKLKSYCNDTLKELQESGVEFDNVVLRHISKAKVMIDIFETSDGGNPSEELLKANPWIATALITISPLFLQEMVYLAEFANSIRTTESQA